MAEQIETHEVKRSIARSVTNHTMLAAFITLHRHGVPPERHDDVIVDLQASLRELEQLESSPLNDAAQTMVKVAIAHSISPSEQTRADARVARDALGDLLIRSKEVKG